jgi:hypothetical protein
MKKTLLLVLAIAGLASAGVQAAPYTALNTYTQGDLLVGFQNSTSTTNLIVNLGSFNNVFSQFNNFDISADLRSAFGANWISSGLTWGVVGGYSDPDTGVNAAFASILSGTPIEDGWANENAYGYNSSGALGPLVSSIADLGTLYGLNAVGTDGTKGVSGVFHLKSVDNSWSKLVLDNPNGAQFSFFGGDITAAVTSKLDLMSLDAINNNDAPPTTVSTPFTLTSSGVIAVPEPSTYALFAFGAFALLMAYRRNRATSNS